MKKFQFNKTAMLQIEKELKVRLRALPVLEAKETALRLEIKKLSGRIFLLEEELSIMQERYAAMTRLWGEMPDLIRVGRILMSRRLVAGIQVPTISRIEYKEQQYSLFSKAAWIPGGIEILKRIIEKKITIHIQKDVLARMEIVRRKTTQKVNLYKKVQIPDFETAIRRIKRFLEDEENLSKSSQKILKNRMAAA